MRSAFNRYSMAGCLARSGRLLLLPVIVMLCMPAWASGPSVTVTKKAGDTLLTCTINISPVMVHESRRAKASGSVSCAVPRGYPGEGTVVRIQPVIHFVDIYRGGVQLMRKSAPDAIRKSLDTPQFAHAVSMHVEPCIVGQRYFWRAELDIAFHARLDYNGANPFFSIYDLRGEESDWKALSVDCDL